MSDNLIIIQRKFVGIQKNQIVYNRNLEGLK